MSKKVADAKVKLSLEDKLTAPLKCVQKEFDNLSKTLSHRLRIPRFSAVVKNMTKSLHGVQSALGTAASRASVFTGVLGLAGGGLEASLTAVTMKTMHMGDSLYHASRHLGMSVTALQLWGNAADNSGYFAELFQQSLATLNRRSAQAYAGQKRGGYTTKIDCELFDKVQEDAAKNVANTKPDKDDTLDPNAPPDACDEGDGIIHMDEKNT